MVLCSRPGCAARAVALLAYDYGTSTVEVGPLHEDIDPNAYPMCQVHLDKLKVPKGWVITSHEVTETPSLTRSQIDHLAQAVRRAGGLDVEDDPEGTEHSLSERGNLVTLAHKAHLRVVADSSVYESARVG